MEGSPIQNELSVGDVIGRTFDLYKRDFLKYFLLFLAVQAVIGVLGVFVRIAFPLPKLPPNATPQAALNFLPVFFGALLLQLALTVTIAWLFSSISIGTAIRFASNVVLKGQANMQASLRYATSKLFAVLAVTFVTGVLTVLGAIAFLVPGLILGIMFSLSLPVLLIENTGIFDSLGRSRKLVANRWMKTLGLLLVIAVISLVVVFISGAISAPLGVFSTLVNNLVEAVVLPLSPISLTIYYYSNVARLAHPQSPVSWTIPTDIKFCQNCGSQLLVSAAFCSNCGAKQPV